MLPRFFFITPFLTDPKTSPVDARDKPVSNSRSVYN